MTGDYDPLGMLHALTRHGVRYVVIGGVAAQAHGVPRTTQDVDVVVAVDHPNAVNVSAALSDLDARTRGVDEDLLGIDVREPATSASGANFTLTFRHGWLDVFPPDLVPGAPPFDELERAALIVELDDVRVTGASRQHLFAMKRSAGRPHDLRDVAIIEDPLL